MSVTKIMKLPRARTANLVEQDLEQEMLIYDLLTDQAYTLNEASKAVFKACGAKISFDDLKRKHKFTDDLIALALDELKRNNLLESEYISSFAGMNRREVIRKVGLATMAALPMVLSITAPRAAMASSSSNCVAARDTFTYMDTPDPDDSEGGNCPNVRRQGSQICCTGNYSLEDDSDPNNCVVQCL